MQLSKKLICTQSLQKRNATIQGNLRSKLKIHVKRDVVSLNTSNSFPASFNKNMLDLHINEVADHNLSAHQDFVHKATVRCCHVTNTNLIIQEWSTCLIVSLFHAAMTGQWESLNI
eukprot:scaffold1_cov375-Pavlova_lutheri.AAC.9